MKQQVDYLIVGQGLAGSCLALELAKRKASFLVIDHLAPNSASRVAAGLFNPITGKTLQYTWRATEFFPFMIEFYKQAQHDLGNVFLHEMPILRPFISEAEYNQWKTNNHPFVSGVNKDEYWQTFIQHHYGFLELNHCGYLDTDSFLSSVRIKIKEQNCLQESVFSFADLNAAQSTYQNIPFNHLIFCEGVAANTNPYFKWTPIKKLKGETMLIETELPTNVIFNRGVFAVPTHESNRFLVGSTYAHDETSGNTEAGLSELKKKAEQLFKKGFKIISTNWGHRPTTPDRRPVLGRHPNHKNLLIFNGLGTKGVSLAPFFAVQLASYLDGKMDLDLAVNIERFYSLSFQNQGS